MQTARSLAFNVLFPLWTAVLLLFMALLLPFPRAAMREAVRFWAHGVSWLARAVVGIGYEVRGAENIVRGAAIYASKHQSAWETAIFYRLLPDPIYVMKKELFRIPFWGWYARKVCAVSVDRSGGARALRSMVRQCGHALAHRRQVVIFPEGTRSAPGGAKPYHPGVAALYQAAGGAPVIPVALNSGVYWGRRSLLKRPGTIVIAFLPPIEAGLDRRVFLAELERRVEAATRGLEAEGGFPSPAAGPDSPQRENPVDKKAQA